MYALRGADAAALDALRQRLSELGHSVVDRGGPGRGAGARAPAPMPGAAVEAALGSGRLSQIRITALPPRRRGQPTERTVLSVVAGPGLADAVRELGWDAAAGRPSARR